MSAMRWIVAASMLSSVALVGATEVSEDKRALITNIFTDVNNCGWMGHSCPDNDPLGSPFCNRGQCDTTCDSQCFYSRSAQSCQPNVPSRCGISGTVCSGPKSNGRASCNDGVCGVTCNANTQYNAAQNDCLPSYTTSSCGLSGQTCPGPSSGNGQAYCNLGQCGIQCNNGYVLDSSTRTCYRTSTSSLNSCPIYTLGFNTGLRENCNTKFWGFQGGSASCTSSGCAYTCSNGHTSSNFLSGLFGAAKGCVNTSNNNSCCGSSGAVCTAPAHGSASCQWGSCVYDCDDGYDYDSASGTCKQTTTDIQNCGRCGTTCFSPPNGYAICSGGSCSFGCNNGYVPYQHTCVKSGTQRARVRARRDSSSGPRLCPAGETACPITGSASFGPLVNTQHETVLAALSSGTLGYECLDISDSLESCGGCSSMGEGQDCTKIAHAADVGCRNGQCTVLQCAKGYVLSSNGSTCTRPHKVKRNSGKSHL